METLDIVIGIILVLISIFTIFVVLMQSDKGDGGFNSTFAGGQSSGARSGKSKGSDVRLALYTKVGCGILITISLAAVLIFKFV